LDDYLLRRTLQDLLIQPGHQGFARIHRYHAGSIAEIETVSPLFSRRCRSHIARRKAAAREQTLPPRLIRSGLVPETAHHVALAERTSINDMMRDV